MLGLIGSGAMAGAIARGLQQPVLASDGGSGRAVQLVAELGGEVAPNAEIAARADVVLLAVKPQQLAAVAAGLPAPQHVVSVLGGVAVADLRTAFPDSPVTWTEPSTAVEVRQGVVLVAASSDRVEATTALFAPVAEVVVVPDALMGAAGGITGVTPAYYALLAEAQVDAAVRRGLPAPLASRLVARAMAGSAALLEANGGDTLAMRRAVTSPGGITARGLAALERHGVRAAFDAAMDATVDR